jgi:hypothetical protein
VFDVQLERMANSTGQDGCYLVNEGFVGVDNSERVGVGLVMRKDEGEQASYPLGMSTARKLQYLLNA